MKEGGRGKGNKGDEVEGRCLKKEGKEPEGGRGERCLGRRRRRKRRCLGRGFEGNQDGGGGGRDAIQTLEREELEFQNGITRKKEEGNKY